MRLLLDESVPVRIRQSLPSHQVKTAIEMGWGGIQNGKLLSLAAGEFDAFLTVDKNLPHQQNLSKLPIAVLVLESRSTELAALLPLIPALDAALAKLEPRTCVRIRESQIARTIDKEN